MPFNIVGRTGPGMRQIVGFGNRSTERGILGDESGDFTAYVCDSTAMRPFFQITLGKLVSNAVTTGYHRARSSARRHRPQLL